MSKRPCMRLTKLERTKIGLNILIDNSDESDDDIGEEVEQLLKIRKNFKKSNKVNANISSNILSLNDSVPLNSLFKNEKTCKNQLKRKKTPSTNKKKLKTEDASINSNTEAAINTGNKMGEIKEEHKYQLENFFEPTLNSKSFTKNDGDLIDGSCLESKLLDDIKYEFALPDDQLQGEPNMNDFVNSFLTNMNDQIVYSNQLPDEIFETEEEISNGFSYDVNYDLSKFNKLTSQDEEIVELNSIYEIKPPVPINQSIETFVEPINEIELKDKEDIPLEPINHLNGSTARIVNTTSINSNTMARPIISTTPKIATNTIKLQAIGIQTSKPTNGNLKISSLSNSTNSPKIESFDTIKYATKPIANKKKEKSSKSLLDNEPEQLQNKRRKIWAQLAKKEIPRAYKSRLIAKKEMLNNCKKLATFCQKERKHVIGIPKLNRSKKSTMATYKRNEQDLIKPQLLPAMTDCNTITMSEGNQELNC